MKRFFGFALMLALVAAPAFAAKNSQSLNLAQNVKVGTTDIHAGDCKLSWTGTGDSVQLTIVQNKTTITVPAKLVSEKHLHKGYVVSNDSGTDQLQAIELSDVTIQLQGPSASGK